MEGYYLMSLETWQSLDIGTMGWGDDSLYWALFGCIGVLCRAIAGRCLCRRWHWPARTWQGRIILLYHRSELYWFCKNKNKKSIKASPKCCKYPTSMAQPPIPDENFWAPAPQHPNPAPPLCKARSLYSLGMCHRMPVIKTRSRTRSFWVWDQNILIRVVVIWFGVAYLETQHTETRWETLTHAGKNMTRIYCVVVTRDERAKGSEVKSWSS